MAEAEKGMFWQGWKLAEIAVYDRTFTSIAITR
jgi:hypothetical protein